MSPWKYEMDGVTVSMRARDGERTSTKATKNGEMAAWSQYGKLQMPLPQSND